jgi:P-type Cu2+ transporter
VGQQPAQALPGILKRLGDIGYAAVPFDPEAAEGALARHNRSLLYRMAFAGFAMMNLMWISIALYAGADQGEFRGLFHWIGFAIATPTLLYSGWPFYRGAWCGLRNRSLSMDLPIAIGCPSPTSTRSTSPSRDHARWARSTGTRW